MRIRGGNVSRSGADPRLYPPDPDILCDIENCYSMIVFPLLCFGLRSGVTTAKRL